jgi:hypothetical protein
MCKGGAVCAFLKAEGKEHTSAHWETKRVTSERKPNFAAILTSREREFGGLALEASVLEEDVSVERQSIRIFGRFSGKTPSPEELADYARTEICRGRTASPLNGAGERTRRLVAKVEGQFLNCSRGLGFQELFDSLDQHPFPKFTERLSCSGDDNFLKRSSADAQFSRQLPERSAGVSMQA